MEQIKSNSTRPKICFFGIFGSGNLGNEATFFAILSGLRRLAPNTEVACICSGPQAAAAEYNISAFPMKASPLSPVKNRLVRALRRIFVGIPMEFYRWYRAILILKDATMLVMTGTGMLGDFGILPTSLHYEIVKWSLIAKLCRCKLLFVSVGVGPIRHRLSRVLVKTALRLADYRSYRDDFSKDYLGTIHFDTKNDFVCPDLAFSLPKTMIPSDPAKERGAAVVGVGIMTYHSKSNTEEADGSVYQTYISKLSSLVSWLLSQGYVVRLLIGDAVHDEPIRKDLRLSLEGKGIKYEQSKIIDTPASSVSDVLSQLAATDTVIASRFHNVLLALMLGKPVVAISYHEKVDALMAGLGLADFCQDIENIDLDKLVEQFTTLEQCAGILKPQIAQKAEAYRGALEEQYDRIFAGIPK
ncbi:MAG TPA: polysaccharide pyruvyl transferase family protein [Candidatus Angelobacter sp.]|jgi:polysaccharide pyruvyl transferase WcaK-like protein|nr:polysaccharide pyruvyl transferase family protein [Candidatus Angelobacter sp.]